MILGVPTEIKTREYRVGLTPTGARTLVEDGHTVLIETGAGEGSGIGDGEFRQAGAVIVGTPEELYARGELIVKVKEPLEQEYGLLRKGQLLFTFLHLAAAPSLAHALLEREVTGIAYETIERSDGSLPLLRPMSEIAGRMAVQVGAHYLQKEQGGRGVLLAGAPGVAPARVVILGGGTAGSNALRIAVGMGADVTVIDINPARLAELDERYENRIRTLMSSSLSIEEEVTRADLVIGTVLVAGARAPRLIDRRTVDGMVEGSVLVDVAIDQGGCAETSRPTTHDDPVYRIAGVTHYSVANMPGAVSRTSTYALTNSTLPFVRRIASGWLAAAKRDDSLLRGVNTHGGRLCNASVARSLDMPCEPYGELTER